MPTRAATPITIGHLYAQDFDPVLVALGPEPLQPPRRGREVVATHVQETKAIEARFAGNSRPGSRDFTLDVTPEDIDIYAEPALKYGLIHKMPDSNSIIMQ